MTIAGEEKRRHKNLKYEKKGLKGWGATREILCETHGKFNEAKCSSIFHSSVIPPWHMASLSWHSLLKWKYSVLQRLLSLSLSLNLIVPSLYLFSFIFPLRECFPQNGFLLVLCVGMFLPYCCHETRVIAEPVRLYCWMSAPPILETTNRFVCFFFPKSSTFFLLFHVFPWYNYFHPWFVLTIFTKGNTNINKYYI